MASWLTASGAALHHPATRVVVVRPGVDDAVLGVVGERVDVRRVGVERVLHDPHPGRADLLAEAVHRRV